MFLVPEPGRSRELVVIYQLSLVQPARGRQLALDGFKALVAPQTFFWFALCTVSPRNVCTCSTICFASILSLVVWPDVNVPRSASSSVVGEEAEVRKYKRIQP